MKSVRTTIKYEGSSIVDKSMDIADLAPSLLALSELILEANHQFNGTRANIKVRVNAEVQQHCFELHVDLAQSAWEIISNLVADERIRTAKEIAEWIGIISGSGLSLYALIKLLHNNPIESISPLEGKDNIQINIIGNSNSIIVSKDVYNLYNNKSLRKKALHVLDPLKKEGYSEIVFHKEEEIFENFFKSDVPESLEELPDLQPQKRVVSIIHTKVKIRKPAYEGKSKWTLIYKRGIEASIEDEAWLRLYQTNQTQAFPGSSLEVELEEVFLVNDKDELIEEPSYRVLKVVKVCSADSADEQLKFNF
jgi:hypothetical protein